MRKTQKFCFGNKGEILTRHPYGRGGSEAEGGESGSEKSDTGCV